MSAAQPDAASSPHPRLRVAGLLVAGTAAVAWLCSAARAAEAVPRTLVPDDYYRFLDVSEPQVAPDGSAVAYLVTAHERDADAERGSVWLVNWDGSEARAVTQGESASHPRFSPDGRYISFLSARPHESASQLWLLDRKGGEARQITHVKGDIEDYSWSPDGRMLALVMSKVVEDPDAKSPRPIVIDRYQFKRDEDGYLTANSYKHLYLVDAAGGDTTALTSGDFDDTSPTWAPDGKSLAYLSNHSVDFDRTGRIEIYLVEARAGATPHKLIAFDKPDGPQLAFSPDGTNLAFLEGMDPKYYAYIQNGLSTVAIASGEVRRLGGSLNRPVSSIRWAEGGSAIDLIVTDEGGAYPARLELATNRMEVLARPAASSALDQSTAAAHTALLATSDDSAPEIYALESGKLRPLSAHNKNVQSELHLGAVQDVHFKSRDGTRIQGQIFTPPDYVPGRRYPTILWIHGGPSGQDQHELMAEGYSPSFERQLFAAQGYVVLAVNYRGSNGRGAEFQRSILADWGHKEIEDLLAGVDYAVARGFADPKRLGVGGWSYGGLLTDYMIASDTRFKAAIAGAGSGNQIATYGVDEYALQYDHELKPPWEATALWLKLSYPFFHAERIRTPTLFMGGEKDFNVPVMGGEQMYMALRTRGVPTELVIYPGEFHVFTRPSFIKDRADRYIEWFARYLQPR